MHESLKVDAYMKSNRHLTTTKSKYIYDNYINNDSGSNQQFRNIQDYMS